MTKKKITDEATAPQFMKKTAKDDGGIHKANDEGS